MQDNRSPTHVHRSPTVTLTMGGKPFTLRTTLGAMRALGRLQGGFLPLFRSVSNVDPETMALVVVIGTDARGADVEGVAQAIYDHGLEDLIDPLTRFLTLCCNGGRDPATAKPKVPRKAGTTVSDSDHDALNAELDKTEG